VKELLLVATIHLLAVMSPGPDFAMVLRNSLVYSRRTGILAAVGLGLGILVHVTYSLLGIALVVSQSIMLFNAIKLLGAAYLVYIGIKSLRAKPAQTSSDQPSEQKPDLPVLRAIRMGFLTNILNPKATLFFLALFTQVIEPSTGVGMKMLYGALMSAQTFAWFTLVAVTLTQRPVRQIFRRIQGNLEKAFGVILIALGLKVALMSKN
jgi:RhtB (resistance to homoserine/threonine) family protein